MAGMRYQPQGGHRVDQSSAIGRSLALAVHGGANLIEVVGGGAATSRGSAQSVKGFPAGLAYDLRAVNTAAFFSAKTAAPLLTSDQSLILDVIINGAPSGSVPALGGLWRSTTQNDVWLVVERDTADTLQVSFRIAGAASSRSFNINASALYGRRLVIAASITRGANNGGTVYLRVTADGAVLYDFSSAYAATGNSDITPTGTEYVSIGPESIENPTRNCNAVQYGQYHLGRVVSAAELASLSAQPWQMFAAQAENDEIAAPPLNSHRLSAGTGAFALAAPATVLRVSRAMSVSAGMLSLSGGSAALVATRRIQAIPGACGLTGPSAAMSTSRRLSAAPGTFSLSPIPGGLVIGRRLQATAGAFALNGAPTSFLAARRITIGSGAAGLAGSDAGLRASRRLSASAGSFTLGPCSVQMICQPAADPGGGLPKYTLTAAPGSLGVVGSSAALRAQRQFPGASGSLLLSGQDARLAAGRRLTAAPVALTCGGVPVVLLAARRIPAQAGTFDLLGLPLQMRYSAQIEYARAPAGSGYAPQRHEYQSRPSVTSSPRPAATQRNIR